MENGGAVHRVSRLLPLFPSGRDSMSQGSKTISRIVCCNKAMRKRESTTKVTCHRLPFPGSVVLKLSTARTEARLALVGAAVVFYVFAFVSLYPLIAQSGVGFAVLPVIVAGVAFGLRPGILAAALSAPANLLLLNLAGGPGAAGYLGANFWMSQSVFLVVGAVAGMMSDLWRRLHDELSTRRSAEAKLEFLAHHDPLTGLFNRYSLDEILHREFSMARRHGRPIGFLMVDVNRFKEVNDRFGHQMGDRVLQTVADILLEQTRETDFVFRYGGDEFLVILPETGVEAERIVRRIQSEIARRNESNPLLDFPVTLSIGSIHTAGAATESAEEVLAEVDRRMYANKRSLSS